MDCFFEIENIFDNHLLVNNAINYVVMRFSVCIRTAFMVAFIDVFRMKSFQ